MNIRKSAIRFLLVLFSVSIIGAALAAEFRSINTVSTPSGTTPAGSSGGGDPGLQEARKRIELRTVDLAKAGLTRLIQAWESGGKLDGLLADSFNDKSRFMDTLRRISPGDAKLRLLGIEATQVVSRSFDQSSSQKGGYVLTSRVSVRAKTQIEYTHPKGGYQKLDGTNEFVLKVVQPLQPLP